MATTSDAVTDTVEQTAAAPVAPASTLGYYLVVRHAFGPHRKGHAIRDEATITAILADPLQSRSVHKVIG